MKDNFITDIYNWFLVKKKKTKKWTIIAIIGSPIFIWLVYLIGKYIWGFPTEITADGILGYIAAIISSIATIFLGFITLELSNRANQINDDLLLLQKEQLLLETRPFIMPTDWKIKPLKYNDIITHPDRVLICIDKLKENQIDVSALSLFITNTTKSFVLANYSSGHIISKGKEKSFNKSAANQFNTKLMLMPGETKELVLYGKEDFFYNIRGKIITFVFTLENRLGKRFKETFEVGIVYYSPPFLRGIGESEISLSIGNYDVRSLD